MAWAVRFIVWINLFLCLYTGLYLAIKTRPELFRAFSAPWQMPWKSLYLTIWDIFTVYTIIHAFITKCAIRSKYERVQLCCALSVRQITRRNALKVRVFFWQFRTTSSLKIGSKSVWNFQRILSEISTHKSI